MGIWDEAGVEWVGVTEGPLCSHHGLLKYGAVDGDISSHDQDCL